MTLVVARTVADAIHFVSDTKRTLEETRPPGPLIGGLLKCVSISPKMCVAFANDVGEAREAIVPLLEHPTRPRQSVREHLFAHQEAARSPVDFLLATSTAEDGIDRIAGGNVEIGLPVAWIGSKDAYERFQAEMLCGDGLGPVPTTEHDIGARMHRVLEKLIESGAQPSVGGFALQLSSKQGRRFRYLPYAFSSGHKAVTGTTQPTSMLQSVGPAGGSFRATILASAMDEVAAIAVYVVENRTGALFYPAGRWDSHVYPHASYNDFVERVRHDYNLPLSGFGFI